MEKAPGNFWIEKVDVEKKNFTLFLNLTVADCVNLPLFFVNDWTRTGSVNQSIAQKESFTKTGKQIEIERVQNASGSLGGMFDLKIELGGEMMIARGIENFIAGL